MIPVDYILVSLDVTSLFTNISLERVIESIQRRYNTIRNFTNVPLDDIIEAVKIIMNNTFFQFDNEYYQQIFGSPMGSPVSPPFADMVMIDLEMQCISKLDFEPLFLLRYVDDIVCCIPRVKLEQMLNVFNSYDDRIKFTYEIEKNNSISFLDLQVINDNNHIITNWYMKPKFSEKFLNFSSSHPKVHKVGMVYNLVDKAIKLSDKRFHNYNLQLVKKFLLSNQYPIKFVEFYIKKRVKTLENRSNPNLPPLLSVTDLNNSTNIINSRNSTYARIPKISLPYIWFL